MRKFFVDLISCLVMLVFVYAAVSKLRDFEGFRTQLGQSPLLTGYTAFVSWLIPSIELLITLLFFFNATRLVALYVSYTLMVLFSGYIVAITRFSDYIPCSCGGILENMTWDQHLVFNLFFVVLTLTAILLYDRPPSSIFFAKNQGKPKTC